MMPLRLAEDRFTAHRGRMGFVRAALLGSLAALFAAALLSAALLSAALPVAAFAAGAQEFAGVWQGAIELPGFSLEVRVVLEAEGDGRRGSIDIPAQGAFGLPLGNFAIEGERVRFAIAGIPGDPTFDGALAGGRIEGTFTQSGAAFPFALAREADAPAEAGQPEEGDRVYADPAGRFRVTVPTRWKFEAREGYVALTDPDGGIQISLLVLPGTADALEEAVQAAWAIVAPSASLTPVQTLEPPASQGVERAIVVNYLPAGSRIYQALAQLVDGQVYLLLVDGDLAALQRRAAQVQIIATSFEITALEKVDLSGASPRDVREILPDFERFIEATMEAFGIPGAAVAVVQNGEVVYLKGFGVKEKGSEEPVTPRTQMMIGSTGKTMTTMLMATLVDEGRLRWDTPVVSLLPGFAVADPQLTDRLTVRDLVCACSGVPRRDLELMFNAESLTAEEVIRSLATFEFFTSFGEAFQYSNQLVATGGYAAAAADGAPFGDLYDGYARSLKRRVLDPIGMSETTLSFEEVLARGDFAMPHQISLDAEGGYEPFNLDVERILTPVAPAGAHWSTAADMAKYLITVMNVGVAPNGVRVVSEENLRKTWEPQVPVSATDSYGLGWMIGEYKGVPVHYHGGNTFGFTSDFAFLPDAGLGVVVLANAQGATVFAEGVRVRLFELVYGLESEVEPAIEFVKAQLEKNRAELMSRIRPEFDTTQVAPYLGRYRNEALGEIALYEEEGQVYLDAGAFRSRVFAAVDAQGRSAYITFDSPVSLFTLAFQHDEEGRPVVKVGEGALSYLFTRID